MQLAMRVLSLRSLCAPVTVRARAYAGTFGRHLIFVAIGLASVGCALHPSRA
jgi:hypothetical protein